MRFGPFCCCCCRRSLLPMVVVVVVQLLLLLLSLSSLWGGWCWCCLLLTRLAVTCKATWHVRAPQVYIITNYYFRKFGNSLTESTRWPSNLLPGSVFLKDTVVFFMLVVDRSFTVLHIELLYIDIFHNSLTSFQLNASLTATGNPPNKTPSELSSSTFMRVWMTKEYL